jgi:hypothetical protein
MAGCARLIRSWAILSKLDDALKLEERAKELGRTARPPPLLWKQLPTSGFLASEQ